MVKGYFINTTSGTVTINLPTFLPINRRYNCYKRLCKYF